MDQKEYGQLRILSLDGSRIRQSMKDHSAGISVRKETGRIDFSAFEGYLYESLETIKLEEIYAKHKQQFKEKFCFGPRAAKRDKNRSPRYTLALINVSFKYAIKSYHKQKSPHGYLYIRDGYKPDLSDLEDHVLIDEEDGAPVLIAVEVPYKKEELRNYRPVEDPIDMKQFGDSKDYFEYDDQFKCYLLAEKTDRKGKSSTVSFPTKEDSYSIRKELYQNGFLCDGLRYVRYKRSAGSSRDGQCLFIPEVLYSDMMDWSSCGIDGHAVKDQASFQAYIALTLSSIKKTIRLSKKSILIIKDQDSAFAEDAVRVYRNENNGLNAELGRVEISNTIWDGEALLDESVFEENGLGEKGMMLLRNRFFKTCAFNTRLQKWFADNGITDIKQLNGAHRRGATLSDIKMVITESSLKYCKMVPEGWSLQKTLDAWVDNAFEGNFSDFGLVKTEQPTGIMDGRMVRTNYQLLNTVGLGKEEVGLLLSDSFDFLHHMMEDPAYLRYYIDLLVDTADDTEDVDATTINYRAKAASEMLRCSDDFAGTKFFSDFRGDVISSFKKKLKKGRIPVSGTYATLFGNGAEFLQAVIQKGYKVGEPLALKDNEIRTTQFGYGQELLCARSPHITMGNLFVAKNVDSDVYREYFNFEKAHEIVCINAIKHNIQHRLNGCDYDSDAMLITDNRILLEAAKRDAKRFLVPFDDSKDNVSDVDEPKDDVSNVDDRMHPADLAKLDRAIAENRIGRIVNLSQFLNSLYWDKIASGASHEDRECRDLYADICKLAVLSGIEIDKAKRSSKVVAGAVLSILQKQKTAFKQKHAGSLPTFYTFITAGKAKETNAVLNTPMSYVYNEVEADSKKAPKKAKYVPLSSLVALRNDNDPGSDTHRKQAILNAAEKTQRTISDCNIKMRGKGRSEKLLRREEMDANFEKAKKTTANNLVNDHVLSMILNELDNPEPSKYRVSSYYALLFAVLVFENNRRFLDRVIQNAKPQYDLKYAPNERNADLYIYGYPHIQQYNH